MSETKAIYIAGPITGIDRYWEAFEAAEELLQSLGYIPLTPSRLPQGLSYEQYARISLSTIDAADAVVFLPGWASSNGASLERNYCRYIGKPFVMMRYPSDHNVREQLDHDLKEVFGA